MIISYITNTRNGLKIGERNQALGVVDALREVHKHAILLEHDIGEMGRLYGILKKYNMNQHIIIGVSDSGVKAFAPLPALSNYVAVLIGHEVPQDVEALAGKISVLAIPGYAADCPRQLGKVRIVRTDGVANTMSAEKSELALRDWAHKFPVKEGQPVIVAMLGGTVDGEDFQAHEATDMAEYVVKKAKETGAYVLASNSPRTQPRDTEAFTGVLSRSGCGNAFFPFSMKNQNNETPYRAMVGMVAGNPQSSIIVTGDSVSMPCEIATIVPSAQMTIYPVSNGNRQNREFIEWMIAGGHAGLIEPGKFCEKRISLAAAPGRMNAARQIAQEILSIM